MTVSSSAGAPLAERPVPSGGANLAGVGILIRFTLKRDRIRLPVWIVLLTLFTVLTANSLPDFYDSPADRQSRAELMSNPAALAMAGPGYGLDDYTFGAMLAQEMLGFVAILTAIMSILLVVRHTRTEEETGRAELLRSSIVGRHSHLTAALAVLVIANMALGLIMAASLALLGIEDIDWIGSIAFGLSLSAVGVVFGAVTAVAVQMFEHARSASGMAFGALGAAYALRAAGDMSNGVLSWLSPVGWAQATRAYVDERWWPLGLAMALAIALAGAAYYLSTRRDVGAGLRAPAGGSPVASPALGRPIGFALRLHKGSLIGWAVGLFIFCAVYGTLSGEVDQFISENPELEEWLSNVEGASLVENWLGYIVSFMAMVGSAYAILAALRMRGEETTGHVEPLLATALSRGGWLGSHLAVALGGSVAMLVVIGLGLGLSASATLDDWSLMPKLLEASLAYTPALWIMVGLVVALFGLVPRATSFAWLLLVYGFSVGILGELLQFPGWMNNLSPFALIPAMPAEEFEFLPFLGLMAIAALLIAAGFAGFRRRDLEMT